MLTIFFVILFALSTVNAADNNTSDFVGVEETNLDVIGETTNEVVFVDDNSTVEVDFDLLEGEGYKIDKNTITFKFDELNAIVSDDDYYIFEYDDGKNCKESSIIWLKSGTYSYNLNLTNNSNYTYTFYGHSSFVEIFHGIPWNYGSDSNLILQGSFKTDKYGNIIDFTHDQHLKLVLSNYNNSCTIISMSKPFAHSYSLNDEFAGLTIGKKLKVGMNTIVEAYRNNNLIKNYVNKVFNIFVHDNSGVKTFTELAAKINGGESEIVLDCDYKYNSSIDSDYQNGVHISKKIIIDGKNHTIDGNEESKILIISGSNVTIKNIIFTNTFSNSTRTNAAIHWSGNNGILDNCNFIQLHVNYGISALYVSGWDTIVKNCLFKDNVAKSRTNFELSGKNVQIKNCSFVNNSANSGGAICIKYAVNCHVNNCSFINNSGKYYGGAVDWNGDGGLLSDCLFINNTISSLWGGAIAWSGNEGMLSNCSFYNNSAISHNGGAIYWNGEDGSIKDSLFENNYALFYGSAILASSDESIIINCFFVNNSAKYGSICVSGDQCIVENCSFKNNSASEKGGAIYWSGNNGSLLNCSFMNCISKKDIGNAVYWMGKNGLINFSYFSPDFNTIYNETSDFKIIKIYLSKISCENGSFEYKDINFSTNLNTYGKLIFNIFNETDNIIIITNTTNEGFDKLNNELNKLNVGKWNVTVIFEGNDNYSPCNATVTITVLSPNSSLTINDLDATVGQEVDLVAKVNSTLSVTEGKITFYDGETEIGESEVINGVATLKYIPTTAGEHLITTIFNSNNYLSSNSTRNVNIKKASTTISASDLIATYNENQFLLVTLNDDNGNPISGATLSINLNRTKTLDTDANGQVKLSIEGLDPKVYVATIKFEGNSNYEKSTSLTKVTVMKADSQIIVGDLSTIVGKDLTISANVVSNNLQINEGTVTFYDGETEIGESEVINGVATLSYTPLKEGKHSITTIYGGNINYKSSNATSVLIVSDYSNIVAANVDVVYSAGSYYTIKVYGTDGKLANETTVKINGKISKTLTTTNGIAKFKVTNVPGTYKMNITALGKSVTKTLTVKHLVTLKSVTVKKSAKKLTLQATLGKVNGKYLKNKKVTFKFNGKKYTAKTDKKGVAKVTIKSSVLKKLKVGKKVTYQATYSKDTVKKTVKIKK